MRVSIIRFLFAGEIHDLRIRGGTAVTHVVQAKHRIGIEITSLDMATDLQANTVLRSAGGPSAGTSGYHSLEPTDGPPGSHVRVSFDKLVSLLDEGTTPSGQDRRRIP